MATGEQALKIAPANPDAHRVLGTIYRRWRREHAESAARLAEAQRENMREGDRSSREGDRRTRWARAGCEPARDAVARSTSRAGSYDKAIPMPTELRQAGARQWEDGATLLVEAYSAAGPRRPKPVKWPRGTGRGQFRAAADARPISLRPAELARKRPTPIKMAVAERRRAVSICACGGASVLLNTGSKEDVATARTALREALAMRGTDERALVSVVGQAERRSGDLEAAEAAARRVDARRTPESAWLRRARRDARRAAPVSGRGRRARARR